MCIEVVYNLQDCYESGLLASKEILGDQEILFEGVYVKLVTTPRNSGRVMEPVYV